ncbi:MAG: tetratricopeptide repeat protein [Magnetococcales bacterium]|nr:tetratricopeptide repeat protein [Magnetococcales bacterium]
MKRPSSLITLLLALIPWGILAGGCVSKDLDRDQETEFHAYLAKGQAYMERKKPQQALLALRQAQQIDPNHPDLLTTIALAYSQLGQSQAALEALNQAHEIRPGDPGILHNLGVAHLQEGNLDQAQSTLLKVTATPGFNDPVSAWYNLAIVYQKKDQPEEMVHAFKTALRADPSHLPSHRALAVFYQKSGQPDQERLHLEKIIALDPGNREVLERLGRNLTESGQQEQANAIFRQLIQLNANHPAAQRVRGRLLEIEQP